MLGRGLTTTAVGSCSRPEKCVGRNTKLSWFCPPLDPNLLCDVVVLLTSEFLEVDLSLLAKVGPLTLIWLR